MQISLKSDLEEEDKEEFINELNKRNEIKKIVETYMTSTTIKNGDKEEEAQILVPHTEENLDGIVNIVDVNTNEKVVLNDNDIMLTDKAAELIGVKERRYYCFKR